jgi:hypothetical protein
MAPKRKGAAPNKAIPAAGGGGKRSKRKALRRALRAEARVSVRAPEDLVARRKTEDELRAEERVRWDEVEYTPELDVRLFRLIATAHSMEEMSKLVGIPPLHVLLRWRTIKDHPFVTTFLAAKECMSALLEERVVAISVNPLIGKMTTRKQVLDKAGDVVDLVDVKEYDNVDRARLAADALRWNLAVLNPKRYGRNAEQPPGDNDALRELIGQFRSRSKELEES